ncbi:hypothetical protein GNP81_16335 [Aliivibrio fischeri]|uniref:hypothetical protein n=1 Tax=Aliivibrio fischeri TaxID=668 RepID=UPI0012D9B296|nr:hypothetical protein [Aliivibrio fischeri]MUK62725.1 hypothetical protein [Aliivibrio fischeri]MUL22375.1 hypothetical protein [Aliivibrio fischeri]MUL26166.1 hypothetical protein [Aliivibrio fischeri]
MKKVLVSIKSIPYGHNSLSSEHIGKVISGYLLSENADYYYFKREDLERLNIVIFDDLSNGYDMFLPLHSCLLLSEVEVMNASVN